MTQGPTPRQAQPRLLTFADAAQLESSEIRRLYEQYVNPVHARILAGFAFGRDRIARAEGCWLHTTDGRAILDFSGGHGVLAHGHNHPRLLAVRRQFADAARMEVHKAYLSPWTAALSHNVAMLLGGELRHSYFVNSGAEAIDGALKLAFRYHDGKRRHVLHSDISYHGKTIGAGSVSAQRNLRYGFQRIDGASSYAFDDLESLAARISELRRADGGSDVYAVLVEPFSASTMRTCSERFMTGVAELCRREDILLVCDEVFSGWARCGPLFFYMRYGIEPDVLAMSKTFGGGKASISGYVTTSRVFERAYGTTATALLHTTTYNGFGEETATALEAVNVVSDEDWPARAAVLHSSLQSVLHEAKAAHPALIDRIGGQGTLHGFTLKEPFGRLGRLLRWFPNETIRDAAFPRRLLAAAIVDRMYSAHRVLCYFAESAEAPVCVAPPMLATPQDVSVWRDALLATLARGVPRLVLDLARQRRRP